jgi:hypothetical protein
MDEKGKHINNWDLPEHKPKPGLWEDIEKGLDKPAAGAATFSASLSSLPVHKADAGLWNSIEKQLDKTPAVLYYKFLIAPVILLMLAIFIYYFSFIRDEKKPIANGQQMETENRISENNPGIFEESTKGINPEEGPIFNEIGQGNEMDNKEEDLNAGRIITSELELQASFTDNPNDGVGALESNLNNLEVGFADEAANTNDLDWQNNLNEASAILLTESNPKATKAIDQKNTLIGIMVQSEKAKDFQIPVSGIEHNKFIEARNSDFNLGTDAFEEINNSILKNFYMGIHFMPENIYHENGQTDVQKANGFGLSLGYRFSGFFLESGLGFSFLTDDGTYAINYLHNEIINSYTKVDSIIYDYDTLNQQLNRQYVTSDVDIYDSVEYAENAQTVNRYSYLRIPLMLGYKFDYRKISVFVKAGTELSLLIKGDEPVPTVNGNEIRIINVDRTSPDRITANWQMVLGAGVAVRLHKYLSLTIEPQYRYYLNSYYSQQIDKFKKPYSVGVRAGVLFNF